MQGDVVCDKWHEVCPKQIDNWQLGHEGVEGFEKSSTWIEVYVL